MIFNEQTSRGVVSSPWRNRLARSAVNRKVGGSSPPGDADLICRAPPTSTLRPGRSPWRGVDLKTSTQLTHQMVRKSQHPLKVLPATRRRQSDCGLCVAMAADRVPVHQETVSHLNQRIAIAPTMLSS